MINKQESEIANSRVNLIEVALRVEWLQLRLWSRHNRVRVLLLLVVAVRVITNLVDVVKIGIVNLGIVVLLFLVVLGLLHVLHVLHVVRLLEVFVVASRLHGRLLALVVLELLSQKRDDLSVHRTSEVRNLMLEVLRLVFLATAACHMILVELITTVTAYYYPTSCRIDLVVRRDLIRVVEVLFGELFFVEEALAAG